MKKLPSLLVMISIFLTKSLSAQYSLPARYIDGSVLITSRSTTLTGYGSGFLYTNGKKVFLITATHVLFTFYKSVSGADSVTTLNDTITITFYKGNPYIDNKNIYSLNIKYLFESNRIGFNKNNDVTVIYIGDLDRGSFNFSTTYMKGIDNTYGNIFCYTVSQSKSINNIGLANDVVTFGYPKSLGLLDTRAVKSYDTDRPLLRKGIIAGVDKINKTIIVDCPSYPGNSGGPVFELSDSSYSLIGFVDQFIPFEEPLFNEVYKTTSMQINNSGYSVIVPIDFVNQIIDTLFK